ncbi:MAG: hypothetical protein CM15mP130_1780 [Verrucomicrobiota bacterium]|nr:MAG: hypothetical protein CM15mP130_1780 [Verrucomicrobiota bacterium]
MRSRQDVAREISRMLEDDSFFVNQGITRFFPGFFDHDLGSYICKDETALGRTGVTANGSSHFRAMFEAAASTDRLIELILEEDKDVLKELLTTHRNCHFRERIGLALQSGGSQKKKESSCPKGKNKG